MKVDYFLAGVSAMSSVFFPRLIVVVTPDVSGSEYLAGTETNFTAGPVETPLARAIC